MEDNYPKAYKEVYEILKYVPEEDMAKIPADLIKMLENNMDKNYDYSIQEDIEFEEQSMLRETKAILAVLYRDYWANKAEKVQLIEKQKYDIQKSEEKKKEKYSYENLFRNKKQIHEKYKSVQGIAIYQKESWHMKFLYFINKIFKRNK